MDEIIDGLWISDIRNARTKSLDDYDIDRVLSVCQDSVEDNVSCENEHFSFADGPHDYEIFESAVDSLRESLEREENVLVHCHAGVSRSVMVCTAALACHLDCSFDQAYWRVRAARGNIHPGDEVRLSATKYVTRHKREQQDSTRP